MVDDYFMIDFDEGIVEGEGFWNRESASTIRHLSNVSQTSGSEDEEWVSADEMLD